MLHASLVQWRTVTGWSFEVPYHQISPKDNSFGWSKNKTEQNLDTVLLSFHVNWIRQVTAKEKQQVFLNSHVRRVMPSKRQSRGFLPSSPLKTLVLTITHGRECLCGNLKVQWRNSCTLSEQNKIQDWMHWSWWDRTVSLYSINPRQGSSTKRALVTLNCSQRKARAREWMPGCPSWMGHHPLLSLPMQNTARAASRERQSRPLTGHQRDGFLLTAVWTPLRNPPKKHREHLACEYPHLAHRHPPSPKCCIQLPPHPLTHGWCSVHPWGWWVWAFAEAKKVGQGAGTQTCASSSQYPEKANRRLSVPDQALQGGEKADNLRIPS